MGHLKILETSFLFANTLFRCINCIGMCVNIVGGSLLCWSHLFLDMTQFKHISLYHPTVCNPTCKHFFSVQAESAPQELSNEWSCHSRFRQSLIFWAMTEVTIG
jgi:hypothetical protein